MSEYKTTIGLEIHAELKTKSKMFCSCKNDPEEKKPNQNVCPICMGHPGTLPVINKEAVRKVLQVGVALDSKLADFTEFDRKNYFYPDIPKGYQISQYKFPLVSNGVLSGIAITRVHLEEDTAKSSHDTGDVSLVDFNRAGVPLMELVTEPVIHSAEQAMQFAKELQLLLQYLNVSEANMEKGEMRVEVNISVSLSETEMLTSADNADLTLTNADEELSQKTNLTSNLSTTSTLGTKVEVKNINSFRSAGRAIEYEFKRQTSLLEKGDKVEQETRGWDENKQATFSQRTKENSNDYRYFPDPDLPKLMLSDIPEFSKEEIKKSLKETPKEKRARYDKEYGIKEEDRETFIFYRGLADFFEKSVLFLKKKSLEAMQTLSNYITSDLIGLLKDKEGEFVVEKISPESFAKLIDMVKVGEISSRGAKDVLKMMFESGGEPQGIAEANGLIQKSDLEEIKRIMSEILLQNPENVAGYKAGKESLLQFFVGQGMKASKGSGNPELIKKITLDLLSGV
jgi:aspartyl-tRNA(Asn)/glutamyl-tRNA(Gln) amidotransferase subunit B